MSPFILRSFSKPATKVLCPRSLTKVLCPRSLGHCVPVPSDKMVVTLSTMPYEPNVNRIIQLADENLTCEVRSSYDSIDEKNQFSVENRTTLILQDPKNLSWPLIVRMND